MRLNNNKGFTLVEMIIVTAIFMVVIMITGDAFKTILDQTMKLYKSEESNIEGVVGLEMFRHDLEQAGFGLPYSYQLSGITYTEAGYAPANGYNDAPSGVPRAFVAGNNLAATSDGNGSDGGTYGILAGTDYLTIKATSVGMTDASQKWTYLTYSSSGKPAKSWPSGNFKAGDKVIMLRRSFQDSGYSNQLVYDTTTPSIYWVGYTYSQSGYAEAFSPVLPSEVFYVYGISSGSDVGMPFNRADYFVATPSSGSTAQVSPTCAPNTTGILYKASVNHKSTSPGGKLTYMPILDCVADMQVVFGWNLADLSGSVVTDPALTGGGPVDTWSNADGSSYSTDLTLPASDYIQNTILKDPGHIRTKLKVVKIYILAQNGRKDPSYTSPSAIFYDDPANPAGVNSLTRPTGYPISAAMRNYRWKVYRLVIKPKNLISNQ